MPTIAINGKIIHAINPLIPVQGARVRIYDVDVGGNGDDLIFDGLTDADGRFHGTSRNWRDRNTVGIGNLVSSVPDVLLLKIRVTRGAHDTGMLPYVQAGAATPPMPVPFPLPLPEVDGEECSNPMEFHKKLRQRLEAGQAKVVVRVHGNDALPLLPVAMAAGNIDKLKQLIDGKWNGMGQFLFPNPLTPAEITAIALLILAVGAVIATTAIASAVAIGVVMAMPLGYDVDIELEPGTANNPMPTIRATFTKR